MGGIVDNSVSLARSEWEFFGKEEYDVNGSQVRDGRDETDEGFWQRVGTYWLEGTGKNLTGKNDDFPWSATFISYILRKAGAGDRFKYSPQHSVYIRAAILARTRADKVYGFWGHRLTEHAPQPGDLVCYARQSGVSFDTPSGNYKSHADLVVNRKNGTIQVIGGNVGNSVSLKTLKLDNDGLLADSRHRWFAVLQNRLDLPSDQA